jgi:hypothetical protein
VRGGVTRAALLAALEALACFGPLGPFPGGHLSGRVVSAPVDPWPHAGDRVLELESDPSDPDSVNVHFVSEGPRLWVGTIIFGSSLWGHRVVADPRVRVRLGDDIYELRAVRVTERSEMEHVAALYREKYTVTPDVADDGGIIFRLEPR